MGNAFESCSTGRPATEDTEQDWALLAEVLGPETAGLLHGGAAKELDLKERRIGDHEVAALAKVLPGCTALKKLNLSRNQIGDSGAVAVARALSQCKALTELSLYRNQIGDAGGLALTNALSGATLTVLYLGSNRIGLSPKAEMAKMSSRYGEVGSSPVHNVHGKSVAIYGTKPTKLEMERAATEQTAREEPWPDVAAMVGSETVAGLINGTTSKLELKGSKIGDVGVITLAKVLAQCSSLKELNLDENDITDAGAATLFQALPRCESLCKISLSSNRIGDAGAAAAADSLVQCEDFPIHLYLSSNEIGDPGAVALMNVLPKSALTCINLESNQISPSVKSELSKMSSGVGMDGSAPVCNKNGYKILIWP